MIDKRDVAFIIPVYNEGKVIRRVAETVLAQFPNVVCVNDGSKDNSAQEIEASGAYLVNHPINLGQGAALQTGIEFARALPDVRYFVTFDADGQHRLEDVKTMLEVIEKEDVDLVLGSRFLGAKAINMPTAKRILLKVAISFGNITSGVKLTDAHNGLRVFNLNVADNIQITMPDMAHASEILEIIRKNKWTFKEVPVVIQYSEYSMSKGQSAVNAVNIASDTVLRKLGGR